MAKDKGEAEQEELGVAKARRSVVRTVMKAEKAAEVAEVAMSAEARPATQSWAASQFADVGSLSQLKPCSSVCRCLMPSLSRDVDAGVGQISSETMAKVILRPTARARMIHPGREKLELPRQPL